MANTLKFKRGLLAGLPTAAEGEPLFTTDTKDLYIGTSTGNQRFQKYITSGATTQILRGDGSLYSFPLAISSPSNGQVLKFNGTNWVNDSDAGITGSGSAGQVAYFTGATTQAGSNNFFWDSTNNRLGIFTNAPTQRLTILDGNIGFMSTAAGGVEIFRIGVGASTSQIAVNLGGTTGFAYSTISDTTKGQMYVRNSHTNNFPAYSFLTDTNTGFSNANGTADTLSFVVGGVEAGRIHSTGNFGIGTGATDTTQKLQVIGDTYVSGDTITIGSFRVSTSDYASALTQSKIEIGSSNLNVTDRVFDFGDGVRGWNITGLQGGGGNTRLSLNTRSFNVLTETIRFELSANTIGGAIMQLMPSVSFAPTSGTGTLTTILSTPIINQTGGANGITRGLYVAPTLTAAADWRSIEWSNNSGWGIYGAGTSDNFINGSLKIGSTTDVSAVAKFLVNFSSQTNWGITINNFYTALPNNGFFTRFYNAGNEIGGINAANGSTELLRLTGTNGLIFTIGAGVGTERMRLTTTNGNLHLGTFTSDTGERLQVNGSAKITGATSINSTLTINTSGQGRTISTFQGAGTDGFNIWIGGGGLSSGIGGGASSNGSYNMAIGVNSLLSNTTGSYNTASGQDALRNNTTGQRNVSNGAFCLYFNTIGNRNIASGFYTLFYNTTGSDNIAIGSQSMQTNTTGSSNIALGYFSNYGNTTGNNNVSIGHQSMQANTTGLNNTAIGYQSGWGNSANGNTTGSNNIFIGNASVGVSATESDRTWIGNSSTTSTWLGGNLLLGTTTNVGDWLNIGASTTAKAHINLAAGTAPTAPNDGDIWFDGTDLKMRIGGVTKTFTLV